MMPTWLPQVKSTQRSEMIYSGLSGLPVRNGEEHSREIARMSLKMLEAVKTFPIRHRPDKQLELRVGIHTGKIITDKVHWQSPASTGWIPLIISLAYLPEY